ncbi:MAG: DUF222 domain-containing protein [Ilumatobacteraceae bacterium]
MGVLDEHAGQILVTPADLVAMFVEHERRSAVLALAVSHVQERGDWADHGAVTMRAWMRDEMRMSDSDAVAWLRRADLLNRYDAFAEAAVDGTLSSSQLREVERCNRPKYRNLLRQLQADLAGDLAGLDAAATAIVCETWRRYADAIVDEQEPPLEPTRSLTMTRADDGQLLASVSLADDAATEFEKAIATALTHEGLSESRTLAERQADALHDIASFFNLNHDKSGTPRHRPHVSLSMHADTLPAPIAINVDTGRPVAEHTANAALCDCLIHTLMRDAAGAPTGFGRERYSVPRKLFNEIAARDGGCRVKGCTRPPKWTHAHHIAWWTRDGGETEYDNLVLLCTRHHQMVHRLDLTLRWVDGWDLEITWPDGTRTVSKPRGAPPSAPPGRPFPCAA